MNEIGMLHISFIQFNEVVLVCREFKAECAFL